jgi:hypothetical protein
VTLTIDVPAAEWLSANQRLHWAQKARRVRALRHRAAWLARQARLAVPTPTIAVVEVSYPRNGTADTDNAPSWKAVCDGLVDAGVIPGDDSEHLVAVSFRRGPKTGVKGLYRLTVRFIQQRVPF